MLEIIFGALLGAFFGGAIGFVFAQVLGPFCPQVPILSFLCSVFGNTYLVVPFGGYG